MAQFTADIAALLAVFSFAAGLVILHWAAKAKARLLKAAGWILILAGVLAGSCTTYYWVKYQSAGEFDHAAVPALWTDARVG